MSSVNKAILIGNVGRDPEIRSTQNGKEIASFSVATSESWKDKSTGERKEKTEWHNIAVYNEALVRVVKSYLKKGQKVYVEGAIQTRKWTDKEGADRYSTEIVLQGFNGTLTMLDKPQDGTAAPKQAAHSQAKGNAYQQPTKDLLDDDIPFMWIAPLAIGAGLALMQWMPGLVA